MSGEYKKLREFKRKSIEQLKKENAGCFAFAWNGYVRIYEEGEKRCECKDCVSLVTQYQMPSEQIDFFNQELRRFKLMLELDYACKATQKKNLEI